VKQKTKLRTFEVDVQQSHLNDTPILSFPASQFASVLQANEPIELFYTELGLHAKSVIRVNNLYVQDRKMIQQMRKAGAYTEDDTLIFTEIAPHKWMITVRKRPTGTAAKIKKIQRQRIENSKSRSSRMPPAPLL